MPCALVTGAGGVLGAEYCKQLASLGYDLLLTGRTASKLQAVKNALVEAYPRGNFNYYVCDLTDLKEREGLFEAASKRSFNVVVNCAGADIQKPVMDYDQNKLAFQIRINFEAAASLCRFALSHGAEKLHIINVSSLCGDQPIPYFAAYSAAKGALTSFSYALAEEVKPLGVYVTAVTPGSVYTRDDIKEYISQMGFWAKKAAKSPQFVVEKSLKAAFKKRRGCTPGFLNKCARFLSRITPARIRLKIMAKSRKNLKKDAF